MTQTPQSPGPTLASRLRSHPESFPGGEGPSQKPRPAVIRMRLVGANPSSVMTGEEQTGHANYLIGNDRSKWLTNVPAYARLQSQGVYPGIDLVYYASGRQLEYDFVVKPGADPGPIRLVFDGGVKHEGRSALRIDVDGDLLLRADYGDLRLRRPLAYQTIDGERRPVAASYVLNERGAASGPEVGIAVAGYDASHALIIDPVLSYSTYLGGSGSDAGMAIAVDPAGSAYVTGFTESPNFPITAGSVPPAGTRKVFVGKLNPSGSALVYATYLGGNGDDTATGIAIDGAGNAYVTGMTDSTNFPTVGAYQTHQVGTDAFVTKLSASGSSILYSTYLGGSGTDVGLGIAVDHSGQVYVTGYTESSDFPRLSAFGRPAGDADAFVTKLNPSLSGAASLVYSTPLGGTARDEGHAIAVDAQGYAYVTGFTDSTTFPTQNAYRKDQPGRDAFVTKLVPAGNALAFSTYLGGSGTDVGLGIAVDASGMVYVTGYTDSADFPKKSPYQSTLRGGTDAFVTRFDAAGLLSSSTYLGGGGGDAGLAIAVSLDNFVYVAGSTDSIDFPIVNGAQANQGARDAFVTKLDLGSATLLYSTYVGGGGADEAYGIALDTDGNAYITGLTQSADFPTVSAFGTTLGGSQDAFVAKLTGATGGADLVVSALSAVAGAGASVTVTDTTKNAGTLDVGATTTNFYLSSDALLDASDILLGSRAVPALVGGALSTASTGLTIPAAVAAGRYVIIAKSDADGVIAESREDNNTASTPVTVGADLVVSAVSAPAQGGAGSSLAISDTTVNQGARSAVASTTKFYLSPDATLDPNDLLLGSRTVPALAVGAASSGSTSVTLPGGTATGTYYIIAQADADNTNAESNETNNATASRSVVGIGPDLIVSTLLAPATASPGSSMTVSNTIKNQGGGPAGGSTVKFYLSTDAILDAGDVLLGSRAVPALASGGLSVEATNLPVPAGTATGTYVVMAVADADNAVTEAQESNNTAVSSAVAIGADLVVSRVSGPPTAVPGATITVTDTTLNQSSAAVGASTTSFYLSKDTVLDGADVPLGSRSVPALAANAQSTATSVFTVPPTVGGQFYILAKANGDGMVTETDVSNNTMYSGLVKIGADLVLDFFSAPEDAGPGATISVTDTVLGAGYSAAGPSTLKFFFSTDTVLDAADVLLGTRSVPGLAPGARNSGSTDLTLPLGLSAGTYYIIAQADAADVIPEVNEGDNQRVKAIVIGADLRVWVDLPAASSYAPAGSTIAVIDQTRNDSPMAIGPSTTSFYLSSDTTLDPGDIPLGSRTVPALPPHTESIFTNVLTLPEGVGGRYYIIARANADNAISEFNTENNTAVTTSLIRIGGDLVVFVDAPGFASPPEEGVSLLVTDTTRNDTALRSPSSTTTFYLSEDGTIDATDVLLGSRAVPPLAPGEASSVATTFTVPVWLTGVYRVIAQSDAGLTVTDVMLRGPELQVAIETPVPPAGPAPALVVTDTTTNSGSGPVSDSTTSFFLSLDRTRDTSDRPLGTRAVPALGPGESSTVSTAFPLPAGVVGVYKVVARSDLGNAITNIVLEGGSLRVVPEGTGTPPAPGSTITVTDWTSNEADVPVGASTTGFYLSTDTVLDAADTFLGSRAVPALAPGEMNTASTSLTLPPSAVGHFYILAKADEPDAVPESDKSNNTSAVRISTIGIDLIVRSVSGPSKTGAGMTIPVTDVTVNLGGTTASASTTRFYLSTKGRLDASAVRLGARAVPPMAYTASQATTLLTIPASTATGKYYVLAEANSDRTAAEGDTTNNVTASASFKIGPDLALDALVAPDGAGPGSTITITDTVINYSPAAAGPPP